MRAHVLVFSALLGACGSVPSAVGTHEPIVVRGATLMSENTATDLASTARVTGIDAPTGTVTVGQAGVPLSGRASAESYAVGLRMKGAGAGLWVLPVEGADVAAPGELTWRANVDVNNKSN